MWLFVQPRVAEQFTESLGDAQRANRFLVFIPPIHFIKEDMQRHRAGILPGIGPHGGLVRQVVFDQFTGAPAVIPIVQLVGSPHQLQVQAAVVVAAVSQRVNG